MMHAALPDIDSVNHVGMAVRMPALHAHRASRRGAAPVR